jgi:hypothetical protein
MRTLLVVAAVMLVMAAAMLSGCPAPPVVSPTPRRDVPPRPAVERLAPRIPLALQRCPSVPSPPLALPGNIREVLDLGRGQRLLVAGLRASERSPCAGKCPAAKMTLALVGAYGVVCWRLDLPAEHRMGPVGRRGKTFWVAGPKHVFAVSGQGRLLASNLVEGSRLGLVGQRDGGVVVADASGTLVAFRATGQPRWRKKPKTHERALALHRRPEGGVAVAFAGEVRTYDADGVRRLKVRLPERARKRDLAGAVGALWVWSERGAYRLTKKGVAGDAGEIRHRRPTGAPRDGRVFSAVLGPDGVFYVLLAERGLYPVRLVAVSTSDALAWSRPFTGTRPAGCRMRTGPGTQLGVVCPHGRVVVRDRRGITRFDSTGVKPRLSLGPDRRYAVAFEVRSRDMSLVCWVRWYGPKGESARQKRIGGGCQTLWHDGTGVVYLGGRRLGK